MISSRYSTIFRPSEFYTAMDAFSNLELEQKLADMRVEVHRWMNVTNQFGVPLGPDVFAAEDIVFLVNDNPFGGDGPHVNTQICVFQLKAPAFSFQSYHKRPPAGS